MNLIEKQWRDDNLMWSFKNIVEYLLVESQGSAVITDWNKEDFFVFSAIRNTHGIKKFELCNKSLSLRKMKTNPNTQYPFPFDLFSPVSEHFDTSSFFFCYEVID